jgi:hypothetical protein
MQQQRLCSRILCRSIRSPRRRDMTYDTAEVDSYLIESTIMILKAFTEL